MSCGKKHRKERGHGRDMDDYKAPAKKKAPKRK